MHQRINIKPFEKTPEQIKELAAKLLKGDKDAIVPLIEAHIELAYKISGKFIGHVIDKSYDKKDSIIAQAFYGLTRAVNSAANGALYDLNITPFIAKSVAGYIRDFLAKDHLIPIEKDAFKEMAEEGKLFEFLPVTFLFQDDLDQLEHDEDESFHPEMCVRKIHGIFAGSELSVELLDKLNSIEWDTVDSLIINKILEGCTYKEIGVLLDKNERFVKYHMHLIQERIKKIYENFGKMPNVRVVPVREG